MITVVRCERKSELKLFERVPELLHGKIPQFIPPFPGTITSYFSSKHPFSRQGEICPFVAFRGGRPVGRIAAIQNHVHNKFYSDKTGFFGFLNSVDDPEVFSRLVRTAEQELTRRGLTSMRGPYNPSINDECGLLVKGFDSPPVITMPYNPSYYLPLYEQAKLNKARDLYAFYIPATAHNPERVKKIVDRVKRSTGITFRNIDVKNIKSELVSLLDIYNITLNRNWGFLPITLEEMEYAAKDLKAIADPNMVIIAEKEGVPVGFSLTMPDVNQLLAKTRNLPTLLRMLKFLWLLKTTRPNVARLMILGVKPEYRNKGIAPVFYYETLVRAQGIYVAGELSWVDEDNDEIIKAIELMGGFNYKSYRIYEKSIPGQ